MKTQVTDDNIPGNYYDKYNTRNPIARYLMSGFLGSFDELTSMTGVRRAYEVGCGESNLSMRLLDRGWDVSGCDVEPVCVAEANQQCAARGIRSTFEIRSLFDLRAEQAAADLVICCEVLEHVPDTERALAVLKSLAKPYLLVSVPREPIWRVLNITRGKYIKDFGNTPGHIQHWSATSFLRLLEKSTDILEVRKPLPWTMVLCRCD